MYRTFQVSLFFEVLSIVNVPEMFGRLRSTSKLWCTAVVGEGSKVKRMYGSVVTVLSKTVRDAIVIRNNVMGFSIRRVTRKKAVSWEQLVDRGFQYDTVCVRTLLGMRAVAVILEKQHSRPFM